MHQGSEVTSQTLWDPLVALYQILLPAYVLLRPYLIAKPTPSPLESALVATFHA